MNAPHAGMMIGPVRMPALVLVFSVVGCDGGAECGHNAEHDVDVQTHSFGVDQAAAVAGQN